MSLALSGLTISHFRSHLVAQLSVGNGPVAISGPNGAGKTNILEAVSMFSPGRGLRRAGAADMARRPESLGWKLTCQVHAMGQDHEIETWSGDGAARQVLIDGKTASQIALGRIAPMLWLVPSMDRLWAEDADGRRRFLDRMVLSFDPGHAEATLSYDKAMRERNRLLKEQERDPAWYGALEARMAAAGHRVHAGRIAAIRRVLAAQSAAGTGFPVADLELVQIDGDMPDTETALREALADSRPRDMVAGRTLVGPHRSDLRGVYAAKSVPARDCSTGEQKALLISLILANARALTARFGAPPILLLDEVAAHLDPARRAALYRELLGLNAQAWMTGTDAGLFQGLGDGATYLTVTDDGGTSQVSAGR